jgi:hypothetical protein
LAEWFDNLATYEGDLPLADRRLEKAATYLTPFIDDHDDVEAAMYINGAAVAYMGGRTWTGVDPLRVRGHEVFVLRRTPDRNDTDVPQR